MRIGELARVTGVSTRTLRFYEGLELLESRRASNGYREYDPAAVVRVRNIRHLLSTGLTLDDVAHFRRCLDGDLRAAAPAPAMVALARRRLALLDERIRALSAARDNLARGLRDAVGDGAPSCR
ncbi:MerR family transcriptional regulator [Micromonospora avicenniae]|uniref:DNA-binding transcriptional regulator, MerR family n=1 Tax=Micromonospora avicenniae TaxID=1198245 RepID=A0A1N7BN44_9ACTN|nr:MerR family transcriptional regulator [Micromonospora avicenniae]SIR52745.1 DNA-binding transcriptional regulator, MerR family [Micromonospora avicenniae]